MVKVPGINCIGYACGVNAQLGPGDGESLREVIEAEGFKCSKKPMEQGSSVNDCECPCPNDRKIVVMLENVPRDVFADRNFKYRDYSYETDYHAMVSVGNEWDYIDGKRGPGKKSQFVKVPANLVDKDDHLMRTNYKYCCCKHQA